MKEFEGKKIIVTGAASGIGRETSFYLAERGAFIIAVDVNENLLADLKRDFQTKSYPLKIFTKDLQDISFEDLFIDATKDGILLSGLVHCAGISSILPLTVLNKEKLHRVLDINFYSFVELVRIFSKKKYSYGGSIVAISSLAAIQPRANELAYITSKAAINAAVPCLAIELASKKIRVNGIMPGVVNTSMIAKTEDQSTFIENMKRKTLLGAAAPKDIASVICFLLSDASKMITGRVIPVDGGMFL